MFITKKSHHPLLQISGFSGEYEDPHSELYVPDPANFPQASEGTPKFPYVATGPLQYARTFAFKFNETHNATMHEWCVSVEAVPTRGYPYMLTIVEDIL